MPFVREQVILLRLKCKVASDVPGSEGTHDGGWKTIAVAALSRINRDAVRDWRLRWDKRRKVAAKLRTFKYIAWVAAT